MKYKPYSCAVVSGAPTPPVHTRPSSPFRSPNDVALRKVIEDKTKIEGDMIQMRSEVRSLRNEKEAAEELVSSKVLHHHPHGVVLNFRFFIFMVCLTCLSIIVYHRLLSVP